MAKKKFHKEQILEAAYQITRDQDLSSLSMRAIARKIGCSVMPIYDSFDSKEDLIYAVNKYSLRKTLYDFTSNTVQERFHRIIEYGFRYPKFFLEFVRFEQTFVHDDAIVCKMCEFLKNDQRLETFTDRELLRVNARIEAFITGVVQIYHTDIYDAKLVEIIQRIVDDAFLAFIEHQITLKKS